MPFKVFVGQQEKGGSTAQEEKAVRLAAQDLEDGLNSADAKVKSVQAIFLNETNPLFVEIIAVAEVSDPAPKSKEK